MSTFRHFSSETTFHGFKRIFVGSRLRWPFWSIIISAGIFMSIYQIHNKFLILRANPLNININMEYQDVMPFPSITICNKLTVRVSFVVNNTILLNLTHIIFPQGKNVNITEQNEIDMKKVDKMWTSKEFFALAGVPKEEAILWCRLPNGQECSSNDFVTEITDEGYCYKLKTELDIKEAGRGNGMKILFNLASYEKIIDSDSFSGARLVIHDHDQYPFPSKGYDLMPGYQGAIVLRKTINKQIGNCEKENPLKYYKNYTYPACRVEHSLTEAARICKCRPYTLPQPRDELARNETIDGLPECTVLQHFMCIERSLESLSVSNSTSSKKTTNPCTGECTRYEFDQELYYNLFRDNTIVKGMIESKEDALREAYRQGRDAGAILNIFLKSDKDYKNLSQGFKKLVQPYRTVYQILLQEVPCLSELSKIYRKNDTNVPHIPVQYFNITLAESIKEALLALEPKIDSLDVEELLRFAVSLKKIHLSTCKRDEICSVAALYDMLTIRNQLQAKNTEIQKLQSGKLKNLNNLIELFIRKGGTLYQMYNQSKQEERDLLKHMMEYYIDQVTMCFNETSRIYENLLKSGQPSMKTEAQYDSFLDELSVINGTFFGGCKDGVSLLNDSAFDFTNRQELAMKIIHLMSTSESGNTKHFQYNKLIVEMLDEMGKKFYSSEYDENKLNQSLYDIQLMNDLLNEYVGQTVKNLFRKSEFYDSLTPKNLKFQEGASDYKDIVKRYLNELEKFFQIYFDKLIALKILPATENLHSLLLSSDNFDDFSNFTNSTDINGQVVCLKKATISLKTIRKNYFDISKLELYQQTMNDLVKSLGDYVEDIKGLKNFHQDNLGLVKIYFRDMGVKISTQEEAYDIMSFFCDMGGIIGLWLGGSIVSLVELFDLLCFERIRTNFPSCKKGKKPFRRDSKSNLNNNKNSNMQPVTTKEEVVLIHPPQSLHKTPDGGLNTKIVHV